MLIVGCNMVSLQDSDHNMAFGSAFGHNTAFGLALGHNKLLITPFGHSKLIKLIGHVGHTNKLINSIRRIRPKIQSQFSF
jgi:hypothetical protein